MAPPPPSPSSFPPRAAAAAALAALLLPLAASAFAFAGPCGPGPAFRASSSSSSVPAFLGAPARALPPSLLVRPMAEGGIAEDGDGEETDDSADGDGEGASLASDFFRAMQDRGLSLDGEGMLEDQYLDDDLENDDDDDLENDDDDDDDEEEEEINFPQSAINAALGFDAGPGADSLTGTDGNVTLTNDQVYSELRERVLDTAGGFVDLVGGGDGDDDDDGDDDGEEDGAGAGAGEKKPYSPPERIPDPELTAGEVVTTVLEALLHNGVPSPDHGVNVLFKYSSPGSAIMSSVRDEGMTAEEYSEFLSDTEYRVLFEHSEVIIDKGDYSFDRRKAFYTARLRTGPGREDFVGVNFILSTPGNAEEDCWLIDSMLIRPEKMRRRRRR